MKRRIVTASKGNTPSTSGFSFDFTYQNDYDFKAIENVIYSTFEDQLGLEVVGVDFRSVDYSHVPEFADQNVSQCGVDFKHTGSYSEGAITGAIDAGLASLGYELIGYDFYSL
nr:MAG TPA: hypothetical protein [Caudoviricetes sp.]